MIPEPRTTVPLAVALRAKIRRDFAGAPDEDIALLADLAAGEVDYDRVLGLGHVSHIVRYHLITAALIREGRWVHAFRSASRLERAERAYMRELRDRARPPGERPPSPLHPLTAEPTALRSPSMPETAALDPRTRDEIQARIDAMTPEQRRARLDELLSWREAKLARDAAGRPAQPEQPAPPQPSNPAPGTPPAPVPDG